MTIALLNTVILTPVTLVVRVSDRRDFISQGAPLCRNAFDQNGRLCPNHIHCRTQRFAKGVIFTTWTSRVSGEGEKSNGRRKVASTATRLSRSAAPGPAKKKNGDSGIVDDPARVLRRVQVNVALTSTRPVPHKRRRNWRCAVEIP